MRSIKLIIIIATLLVTAIWILVDRGIARAALMKLGDPVQKLPLHHNRVRIAQRTLIVLMLLLPLIVLVDSFFEVVTPDDFIVTIVRSVWFGLIAYVLQQSSWLLVGPNGIVLGNSGFVEWGKVRSIQWDRDTDQKQWGVTMEYMRGSKLRKKRTYVRRAGKPETEMLLGRYWSEETAGVVDAPVVPKGH